MNPISNRLNPVSVGTKQQKLRLTTQKAYSPKSIASLSYLFFHPIDASFLLLFVIVLLSKEPSSIPFFSFFCSIVVLPFAGSLCTKNKNFVNKNKRCAKEEKTGGHQIHLIPCLDTHIITLFLRNNKTQHTVPVKKSMSVKPLPIKK